MCALIFPLKLNVKIMKPTWFENQSMQMARMMSFHDNVGNLIFRANIDQVKDSSY